MIPTGRQFRNSIGTNYDKLFGQIATPLINESNQNGFAITVDFGQNSIIWLLHCIQVLLTGLLISLILILNYFKSLKRIVLDLSYLQGNVIKDKEAVVNAVEKDQIAKQKGHVCFIVFRSKDLR